MNEYNCTKFIELEAGRLLANAGISGIRKIVVSPRFDHPDEIVLNVLTDKKGAYATMQAPKEWPMYGWMDTAFIPAVKIIEMNLRT